MADELRPSPDPASATATGSGGPTWPPSPGRSTSRPTATTCGRAIADPERRSDWLDDPDAAARTVRVEEAEAGHRLVWTWWRPDEPDASRVEIALRPLDGGGTRVVVTETLALPLPTMTASASASHVRLRRRAGRGSAPACAGTAGSSPSSWSSSACWRAPAEAVHEPPDAVFAALADPTRRSILKAVAESGPVTATVLSDALPITRQAVAKHLGLLRAAGLVAADRAGRETRFVAVTEPLDELAAWAEQAGRRWDTRLARLRHTLED